MRDIIYGISNRALSLCAGVSAFVFTLLAFLLLRDINFQVAASLFIGLFALLIVWIATEKPNSRHAQAVAALIARLLDVRAGDLTTPAPAIVGEELPELASAVDNLFEQVRSNLDTVNAMAMYDPVTALPNRLHFRREGERILNARRGNEPLALLFVDLDGFKEVNDNLGHAQGDQVLAMVAERLREAVKGLPQAGPEGAPLIARLAGDEFTLLFPLIGNQQDAVRIAHRVLDAIAEPLKFGVQRVQLGASIGVALFPGHGRDLTSLMKAADIAMYRAKGAGRSQVCVYTRELAAAQEERGTIDKGLRRALSEDEFALVFQPQLCTRSGGIVAGEALLRWNDRRLGPRLPDSFMGVAEESSLILDIGDWTSAAVTQASGRWKAAGMGQRLSFGVSPRQLEHADFFPRLHDGLAAAEAGADMLELEMTEEAAMHCSDRVVAELETLRRQGMWVAIDRFGAGASNLLRIRDLPLDRVKLDRDFIRDIDTSPKAQRIVSAVVHLLHGIGAQAIADGVERKSQLDVLRAVGCDVVQGAAVGDPMSEADFRAWVELKTASERSARTA